jgi:hypothetical protein
MKQLMFVIVIEDIEKCSTESAVAVENLLLKL